MAAGGHLIDTPEPIGIGTTAATGGPLPLAHPRDSAPDVRAEERGVRARAADLHRVRPADRAVRPARGSATHQPGGGSRLSRAAEPAPVPPVRHRRPRPRHLQPADDRRPDLDHDRVSGHGDVAGDRRHRRRRLGLQAGQDRRGAVHGHQLVPVVPVLPAGPRDRRRARRQRGVGAAGARDHRLGAVCAAAARPGAGRARDRVRGGGPGGGCRRLPDHDEARAAQLDGSGDGAGDALDRRQHHRRGGALVPRRGRATAVDHLGQHGRERGRRISPSTRSRCWRRR